MRSLKMSHRLRLALLELPQRPLLHPAQHRLPVLPLHGEPGVAPSMGLDGGHRSAMKMKAPGLPGKGSTQVDRLSKVVSFSACVPRFGLPSVRHSPGTEAATAEPAAWALKFY